MVFIKATEILTNPRIKGVKERSSGFLPCNRESSPEERSGEARADQLQQRPSFRGHHGMTTEGSDSCGVDWPKSQTKSVDNATRSAVAKALWSPENHEWVPESDTELYTVEMLGLL